MSDRYSNYELNVLEYLRNQNKVIIYGHISVKNIMDDGLIRNARTIVKYTYKDGTEELQEFIVVLTDKGIEFIKNWSDPTSSELTYDYNAN